MKPDTPRPPPKWNMFGFLAPFQNFYICYYKKHMESCRRKSNHIFWIRITPSSQILPINLISVSKKSKQEQLGQLLVPSNQTSKGSFKTLIPCVHLWLCVTTFLWKPLRLFTEGRRPQEAPRALGSRVRSVLKLLPKLQFSTPVEKLYIMRHIVRFLWNISIKSGGGTKKLQLWPPDDLNFPPPSPPLLWTIMQTSCQISSISIFFFTFPRFSSSTDGEGINYLIWPLYILCFSDIWDIRKMHGWVCLSASKKGAFGHLSVVSIKPAEIEWRLKLQHEHVPPLHSSQSTTWTFVIFVIKFIFSGDAWDFPL